MIIYPFHLFMIFETRTPNYAPSSVHSLQVGREYRAFPLLCSTFVCFFTWGLFFIFVGWFRVGTFSAGFEWALVLP